MKVTEQIDAMRALGTDPYKKLVTPRVISTVFMMFFLTIVSDLVGLVGGSFGREQVVEQPQSRDRTQPEPPDVQRQRRPGGLLARRAP